MNAKAPKPGGEDSALAGFSPAAEHPFGGDGERRVSKAVALWFRNGACAGGEVFRTRIAVN
jgi:hypothetical protein